MAVSKGLTLEIEGPKMKVSKLYRGTESSSQFTTNFQFYKVL